MNAHIVMVRHQLWPITRILQLLLMQIRAWGGLGGITRKVHVATNFGEVENLKLKDMTLVLKATLLIFGPKNQVLTLWPNG